MNKLLSLAAIAFVALATDLHAGTKLTQEGVVFPDGTTQTTAKALEERTAELQARTAEVDELRTRVMSLEERLAKLEAKQ